MKEYDVVVVGSGSGLSTRVCRVLRHHGEDTGGVQQSGLSEESWDNPVVSGSFEAASKPEDDE